ncbi:MAG: hypothetical protein KDA87_21290 [Planctomycetales bacterium]|nr:hypothetical protein [Planctomycetales bacterium]
MRDSEYAVFVSSGIPRIAFRSDINRHLKHAALDALRPFTWRRKAYADIIKWAVRLKIDRLLAIEDAIEYLPVGIEGLFEALQRAYSVKACQFVIVWPPQKCRNRIYVHIFDEEGHQIGFAKVSLDESNDTPIRNEVCALNYLESLRPATFKFPEVIAHDKWNGHDYCLTTPIPTDARPLSLKDKFPSECFNEYVGARIRLPVASILQTEHWQKYRQCSLVPSNVVDFIESRSSEIAELGRVHGDFGAMNIAKRSNGYFLFDWEYSEPSAPYLVDEVMFLLVSAQRRFLRRPHDGVRRLRERFCNINEHDLVLALIHLSSTGRDVATGILKHWTF